MSRAEPGAESFQAFADAGLPTGGETGGAPGRVSLRTLILIRWVALAGQLAAVLFVAFVLEFALPLAWLLVVIGSLAGVNGLALWHRRHTPRIGDWQAAGYIIFDMLQLATLLFLTGGLINPFAILLLAPVVMGATVLSKRATIMVTLLTLAVLAVLGMVHLPFPWRPGGLEIPPLYLLGVWFALTISAAVTAAYAWRLAEESRQMGAALAATQMALGREQQVSAMGALAAAAAHELGSPLSTIAVVAKEIANELPGDDPLQDDVALMRDQTQRCQDILAQLARRPVDSSADEALPQERPLSELVERAAETHRRERAGIQLRLAGAGSEREAEPRLPERPELLHGLGNLIQNAVQHATSEVVATVGWDGERVWVAIADDGPGFPPGLLSRLDEPFIQPPARPSGTGRESQRKGGLGLGIFIAQTLLHRTGARLRFRNRTMRGAEVVVAWQRPK